MTEPVIAAIVTPDVQAVADKFDSIRTTLDAIQAKKRDITVLEDRGAEINNDISILKKELDALLAASESQLKELRDSLNKAYGTA